MVIGSGWCEVIVRCKLDAGDLATENVAGVIDRDAETRGLVLFSEFPVMMEAVLVPAGCSDWYRRASLYIWLFAGRGSCQNYGDRHRFSIISHVLTCNKTCNFRA